MPYQKPEEHWYPRICIKMRKSEPRLYEQLQSAAEKSGVSVPEYMRIATREKLIRDGYLTPDDK